MVAVAIALIAAILLFISGRVQTRRSNDALLEALRLGRAQTPSLDLVDEAIKRLTQLQPDAEGERMIEANALPSRKERSMNPRSASKDAGN